MPSAIIGPRILGRLLPVLLVLAAAGSAAPARAAEADLQLDYRLVDRWQRAPWSPEPGRYGRILDLTSAPDGTTYVLDGRLRAVHVLDAQGRPLRMFDVPVEVPATRVSQWRAERLDVGADGRLHLLVRGPYVDRGVYRYRIDRLHPDGRLDFSFDITRRTPGNFRDIALRSDGRVYVSRSGEGSPFFDLPDPLPPPAGTPPPGIDVYRADGVFVESLVPSCVPDHLDFDLEDRLYVANRCPVPLDSPGPPGPTPTTEPSRLARRDQDEPPMPAQEGILQFDAAHRFLAFEPFLNPEEVAAGPAGVFLSRNVEIYALGEDRPLYTGPTDALSGAYMGEIVFNLDVPAAGGLTAAMSHCYVEGLLHFDRPADRPVLPRLSGALDRPHLEGPPNPGRIAAGSSLAVLMERYGVQGARPEPSYYVHPQMAEPRSVQRWPLAGAGAFEPGRAAPLAQLGLCGDDARDLAMDGRTIYTLEPERLQQRPDDRLPGWSWWPALLAAPEERPALAAVSAEAGRLAALDLGRRRVSLLDAGGRLLADWPYDADTPGALPVDLALDGDRVFLAERGSSRIVVRDARGRRVAAWPAHDGPRALDTGPEGDLYVLGAGGWGLRYRPDGRLLALWPMPDRLVDARDIAVDASGRVYVSWARRLPYGGPRGRATPQYELPEAGIWVFEPSARAPAPAPERGACLAAPDKRARPARLPLGAEVAVELSAQGQCPDRGSPARVVLVVDRSRSMGYEQALPRARDFLTEVLGQLDPDRVEVGLVEFGSGASLRQPLGRDLGASRSALAGLEAGGDSLMGAGIDLALAELTGPRGDPGARRILVLATDGIFKDDPAAAAARARAAGVELHALVFATFEYTEHTRRDLAALTGDPARVIVDPMPLDLRPLVTALGGRQPERGLFEQIEVLDRIPANMRYLPGSAAPPADYDPAAHALRWRLGGVTAAAGLRLGYRLEPLECGTWPTNLEATADYVDALGQAGRLVFPIPEVEVVCDPYRVYLPLVDRQRCRRKQAIDVVLVMDRSSSMDEPGPSGQVSKLELARRAALAFVDRLEPGDRAAVAAFDARAETVVGLTADRAVLASGLAALRSGRGTRIDLGLEAALAVLQARPGARAMPVVVLLSDGRQDEASGARSEVLRQARSLRDAGAQVYTVGLGRAVDAELLRALAGAPERYLESPTADELAAAYARIAESLACGLP